MTTKLVQFQCQREGTLFYYQHAIQQAREMVKRCPVCGSKRVVATWREFDAVDENKAWDVVLDPSTAELEYRKQCWGYFWLDMASYEHNDNTLGPMARPRVAYLLRAARSRQDSIERLASGYVVGGTLELVKGGLSGDRMRHLLEKHGC